MNANPRNGSPRASVLVTGAGGPAAIAVLLFLMVFVGSAAAMRGLQREAVET